MRNLKRYVSESLSVNPRLLGSLVQRFRNLRGGYRKLRSRNLEISSLLLGGENGIPAAKYSRLTNDILRPSKSIENWPHVEFLQTYKDIGDQIFREENFIETSYYNNAATAVDVCGQYFGVYDKQNLVNQAKRFISNFDDSFVSENDFAFSGASETNSPILVQRVKYSDSLFEIVDGHHRTAIAYAEGKTNMKAYVLPSAPVTTPLMDLVFDNVWTDGERELYQPLEFPEFGSKWQLVRHCDDRLSMMKQWLNSNLEMGQNPKPKYIDVGSNYGWFVLQMEKLGFDAFGVDRDPSGRKIGLNAYGLREEQLYKADIVEKCREFEARSFDVVSCYSVLHHFALKRSYISAEELLSLLDSITNKVLFMDTGQSHERWFSNVLPEWDDDHIVKWITDNSSFQHVEKIGVDKDAVGNYKNNYGRSLFACYR